MMPAWVPAGQKRASGGQPAVDGGAAHPIGHLPGCAQADLHGARHGAAGGKAGGSSSAARMGGWSTPSIPSIPGCSSTWTSYTPTRIVQNGEWQLVWYEPKANAEAAALAGARTGRVPGLPADLLVNGLSLAESVQPPLWGYFGPEWGDPALDGLPRCTSGPGTLSLFTPAALEATLALDPRRGLRRDAAGGGQRWRGGHGGTPPQRGYGARTGLAESGVEHAHDCDDRRRGAAASTAEASGEPCTAATPVSSALRVMTVYVRFGESVRDTE